MGLAAIEIIHDESNEVLYIVSIPNIGRVGTKDDYLAGFECAPKILDFRLKNAIESERKFGIMEQIQKISGHSMIDIFRLRRSFQLYGGHHVSTEDYLNEQLDCWLWRQRVSRLASDILARNERSLLMAFSKGRNSALHQVFKAITRIPVDQLETEVKSSVISEWCNAKNNDA